MRNLWFHDALLLNVHFHTLVLDGVFTEGEGGTLHFRPLPPPPDDEVGVVLATIYTRVMSVPQTSGRTVDVIVWVRLVLARLAHRGDRLPPVNVEQGVGQADALQRDERTQSSGERGDHKAPALACAPSGESD